MRKSASWPIILACVISIRASAFAEPPKILSTSPTFWATRVDPGQKVVSLTFDQRMSPAFTAWLGRSSVPPEVDLNSKMSPDRKTFSIDVKLQPGKVYVFGINEKAIPGVGFQNEAGLSVPPAFVVFQTLGNPAPADTPPSLLRSFPANAQTIDPSKVNSITLVFDRQMAPQKHGLRLFEAGKPVDISRAQFSYSTDGRTFTLGYQFKPQTQYRLDLNDVTNIGFASANRIPLWPVQISFTTSVPR